MLRLARLLLLSVVMVFAWTVAAVAAFSPGDQVTIQGTGTSYDGRDATVLAERPDTTVIVDVNEADSTGNVRRYGAAKLKAKPTPTATASPTPTATPTPTPIPAATPTAAPGSCDRNATPSTLSSELSAAVDGQTICLASGGYGTWQGTSKAVTLRAADGATPTMRYSFTTGDSGFTLDGLSGMGGSITNGAHDITIKNSTFTTYATFDALANSNILFDHNTHNDINSPPGAPNARLGFYWSSSTPSGVTIQNSLMRGGDADGVHTGTAVNVLNNEFAEICETNYNHTDNIQFEGSVGGRIAGNYIHEASCVTQGITSFDGYTVGVVIEDNVVDINRPWGIELYADRDSIVRHNTIRWYPDSGCEYTGLECGKISLQHRSTDPASVGTQVYDNVATADISDSEQPRRVDHNENGSGITFVNPLNTWVGFALAPGSIGNAAASDGLDLGIRVAIS